MRCAILAVVSLAISAAAFGQEAVSLPWSEFKNLYRESIERAVLERVLEEKPQVPPQVHSVDGAHYRLVVDGETALCEVLLSGALVSGGPAPIPLFDDAVVVVDTPRVTGGILIQGAGDAQVAFLPDGTSKSFEIAVHLLVRAREDERASVFSFGIPQAVRNSLELHLPAGCRLTEEPGILDAAGAYHFAGAPYLRVAYIDSSGVGAATAVEIDTLSRFVVQKNRVLMTTSFLPVRPLPDALILMLPEGAAYVASSLKTSWITKLDEGHYELRIPAAEQSVFSLDLEVATSSDDGEVRASLPRIEGNTGQQGRFILEQPDDGEVGVAAEELVSPIPVKQLGLLQPEAKGSHAFMQIPADGEVRLSIRRFHAVPTPTTVLDCQYLYSSFEENGNVLSVLVMDVPPEVGARMTLEAVPDASIWSLTVNGAKRQVYAGENDTWVVPLEQAAVSHVELAFLRAGPRLGLHGRLETLMPATGLPSEEIRVGVALPERVELLSAEGPVNAAAGGVWDLPEEFAGKPYLFSRSYYGGEGMRLALMYKEPVRSGAEQGGLMQ